VKIKNDFITNSSSASFILTVKSNAKNLEEFKERFELFKKHFLEELLYKKNAKHIFNFVKIEHGSDNNYNISDITAMLNDILHDTPQWITYLLLVSYTYPTLIEQFGFTPISLKIERDW